MTEPTEQLMYDPESMCLPNSLEFVLKKLLRKKADQVDFEAYRKFRAQQLEDESNYNSPLNVAKRENQSGKVVQLVAQNRDEFINRVLEEVGQQMGESFARSTEHVSGEDPGKLRQLTNRPNSACLLSVRGHIEPITKDSLSNAGLKGKIDDSFELAPFGNITVITKV